MKYKEMFSSYCWYCLRMNGLPVFCPKQSIRSNTMWHIWKIIVVLFDSSNMVHHIYRIFNCSDVAAEIFGFIDALCTSLITNSLVIQTSRIQKLQQIIIADLNCRKYRITDSETRKMKALQFFLMSFIMLIVSMILYHSLSSPLWDHSYVFNSKPLVISYVIYVSIRYMYALSSSVIFYTIICVHLKAMIHALNKKVKKLQKKNETVKQLPKSQNISADRIFRRRLKSKTLSLCTLPTYPMKMMHLKEYYSTMKRLMFSENDMYLKTKFYKSQKSRIMTRLFPGKPQQLFTFPKYSRKSTPSSTMRNKTVKKVRHLNRRFNLICLLVEEADDLLSFQTFSLLLLTVVRPCVYVYSYMINDWAQSDNMFIWGVAVGIFYDILCFAVIILFGSLVSEEAKNLCVKILKLRQYSGFQPDIKIQVHIEVFSFNVFSSNLQLTTWKFFIISKSLLLSVIGVTATYIIVILQLCQMIQQGRCYVESN